MQSHFLLGKTPCGLARTQNRLSEDLKAIYQANLRDKREMIIALKTANQTTTTVK